MIHGLEREEYIEQTYFFRMLRERVEENMPTQEVLSHIHEELLSTTQLPMAVQFLATEIKHTGLLSSGFRLLPHYFTPFQTFVLQQTEEENNRFSIELGLLVLEREAAYRSATPTPAGLFVYQLEALSRNRLGYEQGLDCIEQDPAYDDGWKDYVGLVQAAARGGRLLRPGVSALGVLRRSTNAGRTQATSRRWSRSSARRKARSPRPAAAGTRCTCSPPCSVSWDIRRCRVSSSATT